MEKDYKISIKRGDKEYKLHLSAGMFTLGVAGFAVGAMLFVVACGYSVFNILNRQKNIDNISELQKAGEIRQEQLLNLSKKADSLNETLQNLTQQEQELRIQAGLKPAKVEAVSSVVQTEENSAAVATEEESSVNPNEGKKPDGQGGPINELNLDDVSEALTVVEQRVNVRQESLNDVQSELKLQREQLALYTVPESSGETVYDLSKFGGNPSANLSMPSIWPTVGVVTSPYGLRWGGTDFHPGIDIANDMGTPIVATADGVVEYAGWNSGGYGNMVDINHGNGMLTRYGHASQVVVSAGQHVRRGQVIAYMGSTGFSTGPHVHYEIHVNGQRVNPISYL